MVDQVAKQAPVGQQPVPVQKPGNNPAGTQGQVSPQPVKKKSKWVWWLVGAVVVVVLLVGAYFLFL